MDHPEKGIALLGDLVLSTAGETIARSNTEERLPEMNETYSGLVIWNFDQNRRLWSPAQAMTFGNYHIIASKFPNSQDLESSLKEIR
ncbi:hypothetical protein LAZ67_10001379 [Cordylochernes scorpioides]|uniref:Uncharacterized protein n=1 Tax=Cordylochernes scorpioides TaxID=51811 RepID=A0ABY6KWE7_9ARAC|nr:hypothetical protein LAZ67_10001379 [Cordylochernes scorpioides]